MSALRDPRPERELDEFLARVTHELRSPMCAITGLVELLLTRRDRLEEEQTNDILAALLRQGRYVTRLIDGLVDLAGIEAGMTSLTLAKVDVRDLIDEIARADPPLPGKSLSIHILGRGVVLGDRLRLEQVLRNLLRNAYLYGGENIIVEGKPIQGRYEIVVRDDGRGAPPELVPMLFQPLVRGRSPAGVQGSGLGLSICRKLVEAIGGTIRYEPVGSGARFVLNLARA